MKLRLAPFLLTALLNCLPGAAAEPLSIEWTWDDPGRVRTVRYSNGYEEDYIHYSDTSLTLNSTFEEKTSHSTKYGDWEDYYIIAWDSKKKTGAFTLDGEGTFMGSIDMFGGYFDLVNATSSANTSYTIGEGIRVASIMVEAGARTTVNGTIGTFGIYSNSSESEALLDLSAATIDTSLFNNVSQAEFAGGRVIAPTSGLTVDTLQLSPVSGARLSVVQGDLTVNKAINCTTVKAYTQPVMQVTGTLTFGDAVTLTVKDASSTAKRSFVLFQTKSLKNSLRNVTVTTTGSQVLSGTLSKVRSSDQVLVVFTTPGAKAITAPDPTELTTAYLDSWYDYEECTATLDYIKLANANAVVNGSVELPDDEPVVWYAPKAKGTFSFTGSGLVNGGTLNCIGGKYTVAKGGAKGKAVYNIKDVNFDGTTINACWGATVNLSAASLTDATLGVNNKGILNISSDLTEASLDLSGGTVNADAFTATNLSMTIDSSTVNLFNGDLTLADGAEVSVTYRKKTTKPMLAVKGVLTLGDDISVSVLRDNAKLAAHDFILFQTQGVRGSVSALNTGKDVSWTGTFATAVVNGNQLVVYVQDTAKPKYSKPKAVGAGMTAFFSDWETDAAGHLHFIDSAISAEDASDDRGLDVLWTSTKGKDSYRMSGESTLETGNFTCYGKTYTDSTGKAAVGKASYTIASDITLHAKKLEAAAGAAVTMLGTLGEQTILSVNAGSGNTTRLDVTAADCEGTAAARLNFAGGTIAGGSMDARYIMILFNSGVRVQNVYEGNLNLVSGSTVDIQLNSAASRPALGVTGTLTLGQGTAINLLGSYTKQGNFVIFQARKMVGELDDLLSNIGSLTLFGETISTDNLRTAKVNDYYLLAYVKDPSKNPSFKAVKLPAYAQVLASAVAEPTVLEFGEEGGALLSLNETLSGEQTADEALFKSGITETSSDACLMADTIRVGTDAAEFNATLNNNGTLDGAVEITKNASIDNQGTILGAVMNRGTLHNDGRISGAVTVASGATLSGSGSITSLTLADGAILSSTGETMTVQSLTLGGTTEVSLYIDAAVGSSVDRELLRAESVQGEGSWSLTLSDCAIDDAELVWEDGVLRVKGTMAEQALVAAPAVVADTRVPKLVADSLWAAAKTTQAFVDNALGQYRDFTAGKTSAYVSALGSFVNMSGFTANGGGAAVGVEHNVAEGAALGLSLGYTDSKLKGEGAFIDQDSTHLAAYTNLRRGAWGLKAYAAYGDSENKLRGGFGSFDMDDYAAGFTVSRSFGCVSLFSGLNYAAARTDCADGSMQAWQLPVGATVSKQFGKLVTSATVAYVGDVARQNPRVKVNGQSIRGANPGRSAFELNLGATYLISDSWSASTGYSLETRSGSNAQSVNASLRWRF